MASKQPSSPKSGKACFSEAAVARLTAAVVECGYEPFDTEALLTSRRVLTHSSQTAIAISIEGDGHRIDLSASVNAKYWFGGGCTDANNIIHVAFALTSRQYLRVSTGWYFESGMVYGEIDLTALVIEQPTRSFPCDDTGLNAIAALMHSACLAHLALADCEHAEAHEVDRHKCDWSPVWAEKMLRALGRGTTDVTVARRSCPAWSYWYDPRDGTSFLHAPRFVQRIRALFERIPDQRTLLGVDGEFYLWAGCTNFVQDRDFDDAWKILALVGESKDSLIAVPFEDWLVCLGKRHAIWLFRRCGRQTVDGGLIPSRSGG